MSQSILQEEKVCFICPRLQNLEQHHIFGGANRRWSEKYGLKVWLCPRCHRDQKEGVHGNKEIMKIFGKNYL